MLFKLKLLTYIQLRYVAVFLISFNISGVHAEKFDLGPFKGKLTGSLTFSSNYSYKNYMFSSINLTNGKIKRIKNFKVSLRDIELYEPEISLDKTHVLFTGNHIINQTLVSQIIKLDLKSYKTSIWLKSKSNISNPRYSKSGEQIVFTQFYETDLAKNITYNLKSKIFTELQCPKPNQCVAPNWENKNEYIIFTNNLGNSLYEININLNKIKQLYRTKTKNYYISYPSYTNNGNIIFTEIYKPGTKKIESSKIMILIKDTNKISTIVARNNYVPAAITLNDDRFIAFTLIKTLDNAKIIIYDSKTTKHVVYREKERLLSVPVWRKP